jgi:hypothetical protein
MEQRRIPCPECGTFATADGKVQCPRCGWMASDHDAGDDLIDLDEEMRLSRERRQPANRNQTTIDLSTYRDRVPESLLRELERYVNDRCPVSHSTDRLLSNDLTGAVGALDDKSYTALKAICEVIHWQLPATCHGSAERVRSWLKGERS